MKMRGNLPVECEVCGLVLAHKTNLNRHIKRRHDPSLPFNCSECTYRFEKESHLRMHVTKDHFRKSIARKRDPKYCEECEESFETENELTQHLMSTHKTECPQLFTCEFCDKTFTMHHNLMRHYRTVHHDQLDFECTICCRKFKSKEYLYCHVTRVHESKGEDRATAKATGEQACGICDQTFNGSKYRFERHMIAIHPEVNEKIYECDACAKKFIFRMSLRLHLDKHRRRAAEKHLKFKCGGCYRRFEDEQKMMQHR
jgi:hypothetical protein